MQKRSFLERLKYTRKNNWFVTRKFLGFSYPVIASDLNIEIHYIWRDIQIKNKRLSKK